MPEKQRPKASDKPLLLPPGRSLPYNHEAELAVLGAVLLDPDRTLDDVATTLHDESYFHSAAHQTIYRSIRRITDQGARLDLISLGEDLERHNELDEAGGRDNLMDIVSRVVTVANADMYADIVRQNALLRRLIRTSSNIVYRCTDPEEETASMLDDIETEIMQLTRAEGGAEATPVADCIMGAVDYMEKLHRHDESAIGIQTGYDDLDRNITGLQAGEMFVLAARPSIGKTAFALNIAANMALREESPVPVGIFSLEMSRELLTLRLLCSEARVNLADIREGAVSRARWTEITEAAGRFREAPICIDDTGNLDIVEMRAKARRMVQKFGTRVFVVDYLQLMKSSAGPNATRENEVAKNSMGIKSLAKELGVPIVVLAQLNRQAEQPGQRPKLSHLRESGAIEQDADVVALLHRERAAEPGEDDNREMEAELIIAKHRNGPTGTVPLTFLKQYTRFESRARFGDADVP